MNEVNIKGDFFIEVILADKDHYVVNTPETVISDYVVDVTSAEFSKEGKEIIMILDDNIIERYESEETLEEEVRGYAQLAAGIIGLDHSLILTLTEDGFKEF